MNGVFVSAHRYRVKPAEIDEILAELVAALRSAKPAKGAARVQILRGEGNTEVAIIVDWTNEASAHGGWNALYQSEDLQSILSRATLSEAALYTVAAVREMPAD